MQNLGQWYYHKNTQKPNEKTNIRYMLIFKIVLKDWAIITISNIEHKYESCREINKINHFLKQIKLVKNITFNSSKSMKISRVTMLSLKYVEKSKRTGKQTENQSFYNKPWILQTNIYRTNRFTLTIITTTNRFTGITITWTDRFTWANVNWKNRYTWKNSSCTSRFT